MSTSEFGADIFDPGDEPDRSSRKTTEDDSSGGEPPKKKRKPRRKKATADKSTAEKSTADESTAHEYSAHEYSADEHAVAAEPREEVESPPSESTADESVAPRKKRRRKRSTPKAAESGAAEAPEERAAARAPEPLVDDSDADEFDADASDPDASDPDEPRRARGDFDEPRDEEGDDERRRGRRGRRRRRRAGDDAERRPGAPAPSADTEVHGSRIAVLIDLRRLRDEATARGGELAFGRLLRHLSRRRHLIRAIAYVEPGEVDAVASTLLGNGLDVRDADQGAMPVAMAVDAMALASRVDSVVVLPGEPSLAPLARTLDGAGVRLETGGFAEDGGVRLGRRGYHHELGQECLFQP